MPAQGGHDIYWKGGHDTHWVGLATTFLLVLVCAARVSAARLERVVVDQDRKPLTGVSVITNLPGVGTQTDSAGQCNLTLSAEINWVTFSCVGFRARQFSVGQIPDPVMLEPMAYRGEDIIVTVDRARQGVTPLAYENFSRDKIARDYKIGEFPLLLESTPNLYAHADAGAGLGYSYISIRGFDDKRVAVYINGVPLNDPEDQATYFVDLPDFGSTISDIQIQRGVGNSLYGDASFGGSVNVVTNAFSRERRTTLSTGYGKYSINDKLTSDMSKQTINYSSGLVDGRWLYGGRFSRQSSGGYRYNSWYEGWSYYLSAARLDPKMSTELHVYGGPMRMHLAYLGATLDDLAIDRRANQLTYGNETDNFNQPHYQLHNIWKVSDRATLSNTLYYIRGKGYYEQLKSKRYYSDYNIAPLFVDDSTPGVKYATGDIVRQQWVYKNQIGWNPRLDIDHTRGSHALGGSFYYFDSDHWGQAVWGEHLSGNLDPRQRYYQYFGKKYVASIFGQEIYKLSSRFTTQVTAQLRYQRYKFNQDKLGAFKGYAYDLDWFFFSPRVGLTCRINEAASLFGNIAVSSRTPTDADIYDAGDPYAFPSLNIRSTSVSTSGDTTIVFGDPTAKSERVYDFELGGTYTRPRWNGNATLYWMEFRNEIIPFGGVNQNTGIPFTANADRSVHAGIELSAGYSPAPHLKLSGNGAFNYLRVKKYTANLPIYDGAYNEIGRIETNLKDKRLAGFPETLGNLLADYKTDRVRLTYRLRWVGKQYMELLDIDSLAIKGHTVSSFSGEYRLPRFLGLGTLSLSLTVENLFNQKFLTSGYGWNYGYQATPTSPLGLLGEAEYFVNAERSFYAEMKLEMF
jgi:iron complex outermembrane receptor protein